MSKAGPSIEYGFNGGRCGGRRQGYKGALVILCTVRTEKDVIICDAKTDAKAMDKSDVVERTRRMRCRVNDEWDGGAMKMHNNRRILE